MGIGKHVKELKCGLCFWGAEQGFSCGVEIEWRRCRVECPVNIFNTGFQCNDLKVWNKDKYGRVVIILTEGQLHILFIIMIINILPPVVHSQEVCDTDTGIELYMLHIVFNQLRQLEELYTACRLTDQQYK